MSACDCYGCDLCRGSPCQGITEDFCTHCSIRLCEDCMKYNRNEEPVCRGGCKQ